MANEAYRAVFLRVHPTGKMVLSLTTEPDGNEAQYARLVADELGIPALDVKVVPADTDRFGVEATATTRAPPKAPRRRLSAPPRRFAPRVSCWRAWRWEPRPRVSSGSTERGSDADGSDPTQVKTVEEIALYAHETGELPPGVEGGLDAQTVYAD